MTKPKSSKSKHTYLVVYENIGDGEAGIFNGCAQIHHWHDDQNITIEWLPYFDMIVYASTGNTPSFEPIDIKNVADINLSEMEEEYELHYTFLTVLRDFVKSEKVRDRRENANKR